MTIDLIQLSGGVALVLALCQACVLYLVYRLRRQSMQTQRIAKLALEGVVQQRLGNVAVQQALAALREAHTAAEGRLLDLTRSNQASEVGEAVQTLHQEVRDLSTALVAHAGEPHLLPATPSPDIRLVVAGSSSAGPVDTVLPADFSIGESMILGGDGVCGGQHIWQPRTIRAVEDRLEAVDTCVTCGPDGPVRIRRLR